MLSLLSWIYGKLADLRNTLYERGVFDSTSLGARTISIGNITTGGTGKTPLVAYVAAILADRGEIVCILSRGYGRKNPKKPVLVSDAEQIFAAVEEAGDEPLELARKLLGKAIVISDADRVAAGEWAKRKFGVTVFVLDDGFQHRRAKRDVDIVCVDATNPFGGGKMLPAGRLREPVNNLRRADVVVITRANHVKGIEDLKSEISKLNKDAAIFESGNEIVLVGDLEKFHAKTQRTQSEEKDKNDGVEAAGFGIHEKRSYAFCGLGNPENFFQLLRYQKYNVCGTATFTDHYVYTQKDVDLIVRSAKEAGAELLLTTAKDAVKLSNLRFEVPCCVVEIASTIDDADDFAAML